MLRSFKKDFDDPQSDDPRVYTRAVEISAAGHAETPEGRQLAEAADDALLMIEKLRGHYRPKIRRLHGEMEQLMAEQHALKMKLFLLLEQTYPTIWGPECSGTKWLKHRDSYWFVAYDPKSPEADPDQNMRKDEPTPQA